MKYRLAFRPERLLCSKGQQRATKSLRALLCAALPPSPAQLPRARTSWSADSLGAAGVWGIFNLLKCRII